MNYKISSRDYLERAKQCLIKGDCQSLFYATFEIRCGIEARMQQYLEVQDHISQKKREGWKVAKLASNIEDAFRLGDKDAVIRIRDQETNKVLLEARYTPVKKSLRKKAQKLGNFLHNAKKYYAPEDEHWIRLRHDLEEAVAELEQANSGRLLGPLLRHPDKKNIIMKLEVTTPEEREISKMIAVNEQLTIEVDYK
jgi:hypothetical protein